MDPSMFCSYVATSFCCDVTSTFLSLVFNVVGAEEMEQNYFG